jgi:hypothetical protein
MMDGLLAVPIDIQSVVAVFQLDGFSFASTGDKRLRRPDTSSTQGSKYGKANSRVSIHHRLEAADLSQRSLAWQLGRKWPVFG